MISINDGNINNNGCGMRDKIVTAAVVHFEAQKVTAEANLLMYLERGVQVSEHPDMVAEVVALTKKITEASDCIRTLTAYAREAK